jgi:hypothetical protein
LIAVSRGFHGICSCWVHGILIIALLAFGISSLGLCCGTRYFDGLFGFVGIWEIAVAQGILMGCRVSWGFGIWLI